MKNLFAALALKKGMVVVLLSGSALLAIAASRPPRPRVSYDVELAYHGISGHHVQKAADCTEPVYPNGYDSLVGRVTGNETGQFGDDIEYFGLLTRRTKIGYCDLKGTGDQVKDCAFLLTGTAVMDGTIEVHGEYQRGAWLKVVPGPPPAQANASVSSGGCQGEGDALAAYRGNSDGGGGSPNGQPIEDTFTTDSAFAVSGIARLKVGYYPPDPQAGGWAMRVIRRIP